MAGPEFHTTRIGQRLMEVTLPRIADELANLVNAVTALTALLRDRLPPATTTAPAPTKPSE